MKINAVVIFFLLLAVTATAQQNNATLFSVDAFIQQVKAYHPVAKQANILVDKADAQLLASRGNFDPTFAMDATRKTFDGKNYYYHTNPELKIPTRIGADIKAGLENNGGAYMNPELSTGKTSYLGIEMPLLKGLVMDKRRAALQQAKIFQSQSNQEKLQVINNLLFDAYTAYWQWAGNYQLYMLYTQYQQIATARFRLVQIAYANGDRAAMDTLEAYTQVLNFQMLQADAMQKINDASIDLSNYLWQENDVPYQVPQEYKPDTLQFTMAVMPQPIDELVTKAAIENPALRSYTLKLDALEVERKLKLQSLLPVLNAKANLLNKDYYVLKGVNAAFVENNYKWGIDFKLPLFLREGRGDYKTAKLKIQETNYAFSAKRWEVENKIRSYYNQFIQVNAQIEITKNAYTGLKGLLRQEELKLSNGESSLFMVNSRENKLIETAQKLIELRIKYQKSYYAILWSAGLLR